MDKYPWRQFKSNGRAHFTIGESRNQNNAPVYSTACGKQIVSFGYIAWEKIPLDLFCSECLTKKEGRN
jgi:hypothetical protein